MPINDLAEIGVDTIKDARLSEYTTFRLGGPCPWLIDCHNPAQLEQVIAHLIKEKIRFVVIGAGSNLVVSDKGVDAVVVRYYSRTPLVKRNGNELFVAGSTGFDDLALYAAENGLAGLNFATGIPGTVAGAVIGNAGAFGQQIGDVLVSATLITPKGERKEAVAKEMKFSYRHSALKESRDIVVAVRLALNPGDKDALMEERHDILRLRWEKHPDPEKYSCAGSFFRNIEPSSKAEKRQAVGWFLEEAGAKEFRVGGAAVFSKHANMIVKDTQECKAEDVLAVSRQMHDAVKKKFKLDLIREVQFVGEFEGTEKKQKEIIW